MQMLCSYFDSIPDDRSERRMREKLRDEDEQTFSFTVHLNITVDELISFEMLFRIIQMMK